MTIQEFKKHYGLTELNFGKTNAGRFISSFRDNGIENKILSRTNFNPSQPAFIYENNILVDEETGELVPHLFWLSNTDVKVEFSL